jgi:hypothetical protein
MVNGTDTFIENKAAYQPIYQSLARQKHTRRKKTEAIHRLAFDIY